MPAPPRTARPGPPARAQRPAQRPAPPTRPAASALLAASAALAALAPLASAWLPSLVLGTCLLGQTAVAAPAGDDWSLERGASDPALLAQRLAKLRKSPFDLPQYRALEASLGKQGLARKLADLLARSPDDLALGILDARAHFALGDFGPAAERLAALEPRAGALQPRVLELRVRALQASGELGPAIAALEAAAARARGPARFKLLQSAYDLADQAQRPPDALRLAQALAREAPGPGADLRLARAASHAGDHPLAAAAYTRAIAGARDSERPALRGESARARLHAGDPAGAAQLAWAQLEAGGDPALRQSMWQLLAQAAQQDGATEALVHALERYLATHARDAEAWRTLARAQIAAGGDPVPAWRQALALDPGDPDARAALIGALESAGDPDAALAEFRLSSARGPERVQLGLDLAGRLISSGKRAQGLEVAAEVEASAGAAGSALLRLLDFYNLNDEPARALVVAQRLVKAHPRDPDALTRRIRCGSPATPERDLRRNCKCAAMPRAIVRASTSGASGTFFMWTCRILVRPSISGLGTVISTV